MVPVIALTGRENGEISYEIRQDGTLILPRRERPPSLWFEVETHRGRQRSGVCVETAAAGGLVSVEQARPADLLARWQQGQAVLEPLLLAGVRALAAGQALADAARRPVRVEPAPGVLVVPLRTPTLPPATHTNCVLVGDRELTLIEPATPFEDELARLDALLAELAAAGRRVVALLLTHHHQDHVAAAERLRDRLGVPLCAHAETARRIRAPVDRALADGEEAFGLRAVFTPGHAPGHLCYLEPRTRTLIAGDMVAGEGTILVSTLDEGDMSQYLASLARLAALDLFALVPAHGPPTAAPRALLEYYIAHRLMREQRVLAALAARGGAVRAEDILPQVYDDTPQSAWPLAALSLEAHLTKLAREGRARREGATWRLTESHG